MGFVSKIVSGVFAVGVAFGSVNNPSYAGQDDANPAPLNSASSSTASGGPNILIFYPPGAKDFLKPGQASLADQKYVLMAAWDVAIAGEKAQQNDEVLKAKLQHMGCAVGDRFTSGTYVKACAWNLGIK